MEDQREARVRLTLAQRLTAAWKAFMTTTAADPEALNRWKAAKEQSEQIALGKLDGFDRALVTTVLSAHQRDAEGILARIAPSIEKLEIKYQIWIAAHLCRHNPALVLAPTMRKISERLAPHLDLRRGLANHNITE